MSKSYNDFVERMGSFENVLSVNNNELTHYGVLGMHWGRRKGVGSDKSLNTSSNKFKKADAEWEKGINNQTKSKKLLGKIQNNPQHQKEIDNIVSDLQKSGLTGRQLEESVHYAVIEKVNNRLLKDPEAYNPSKTKVMMMVNVATQFGTMARPTVVDVDQIADPPKVKHSDISSDDLYHYGVPGMKWGRRKAEQVVAAVRNHKAKKIATYSKDHHHELTSQRNPAVLSDAEIKQAIARMNLEVQYRNLKRQNVSEGRRIAAKIIGVNSENFAKELAKPATAGIVSRATKVAALMV